MDIAVDVPAGYLDRIRECVPELKIATARLNRDGLINDVVIVNQELVFRFPKDDVGRRALAQEARVLDLVRRYVTLPVPHFEHLEDDFVMYRFMTGDALHQGDILGLDEYAQDQLAEALAIFLLQLHAIPAGEAIQCGIHPSDAVRGHADWLALYEAAERELFPLLMSHAKEWIARHFAPLIAGELDLSHQPTLIHGDLGPYHILYNHAARRLGGVIDFGTAGLGDRADDFANIIHGLGERFLKRMSRYDPAISGAIDRARFQAGTLEIQWALGGLRSGDLSWMVCHIGRARDMLPIGAHWS
jgi:aminoglycoside 2''-phosphotransferase